MTVIVDCSILHYEIGPVTTNCTGALNITAILADPLFSNICGSLLKADHTALAKISLTM
jgi:hypothetical protein